MTEHGGSQFRWFLAVGLMATMGWASSARAQSAASPAAESPSDPTAIDNPLGIPDLQQMIPPATTRSGASATLQILVLMTLLSLAPSLVIMTTCFTRIVIVLSLVRRAIGTQQLPPNQIVIGLSLFMTFAVMAPTWEAVYNEAILPWLNQAPGVSQERALAIATGHVREFMFDQIERTNGEESVYLFYEYARKEPVPMGATVLRQDIPTSSLVPAFMISEVKTAFVMGFRVYLPFLVIDMVIASVLVSMGMMMLPPMLVSLPFKLLLFVLADGWNLVVGSLLASFR
jgi:flagellar biosynthetic protein FliP